MPVSGAMVVTGPLTPDSRACHELSCRLNLAILLKADEPPIVDWKEPPTKRSLLMRVMIETLPLTPPTGSGTSFGVGV